MIEGVVVRQLKPLVDERGWLMEILKKDWYVFEKFGQVYVTAAYPNVVKAWHMHKKQTDHLVFTNGIVNLVLYDDRKGSKTRGEINEFLIGEQNQALVKVPPEVWHGFKVISQKPALVVNASTELYDYKAPDEYRLPPDTDEIPYDWKLVHWLKHG